MNFGWLKNTKAYEASGIKIFAIDSYDEAIAEVDASSDQDGRWLYPPISYVSKVSGPRVPTSRFELPITHTIEDKTKSKDTVFLEFMIMYYGWLNGQRLNPEGWGHLTKTAIKSGLLTDFIFHEKTIPSLLDKAEIFWQNHQNDGLTNLMTNAIHWYLYAHSYNQYFERFMAQYMVLDTLYKITMQVNNKSSANHTERIKFVSNTLGMQCPSWGVVNNRETEIAKVRNNLIHESSFAGKPIGFGFPSANSYILPNLEGFNCRVIAALFGLLVITAGQAVKLCKRLCLILIEYTIQWKFSFD